MIGVDDLLGVVGVVVGRCGGISEGIYGANEAAEGVELFAGGGGEVVGISGDFCLVAVGVVRVGLLPQDFAGGGGFLLFKQLAEVVVGAADVEEVGVVGEADAAEGIVLPGNSSVSGGLGGFAACAVVGEEGFVAFFIAMGEELKGAVGEGFVGVELFFVGHSVEKISFVMSGEAVEICVRGEGADGCVVEVFLRAVGIGDLGGRAEDVVLIGGRIAVGVGGGNFSSEGVVGGGGGVRGAHAFAEFGGDGVVCVAGGVAEVVGFGSATVEEVVVEGGCVGVFGDFSETALRIVVEFFLETA